MIASLLLGLQLAAAASASTPASFTVRTETRSVRVPLVATSSGPAFRPEQLSPLLDVDVRRLAPGRYRVAIQDVPMELEPGVAMVRVAGAVRPLANPPLVHDGQLLVPLQFVSEIVPSVVNNLRWDGRARQLVIFSFVDSNSGREQVGGAPLGRHQVSDPPRIAANTPRAVATRSKPRGTSAERHVVVVDAGHGGPDNGMSGPIGASPENKIYEKNITLAVAKKLGNELTARGVKVVYTRTTDTLIALSDRGRIANQAGGDLFISIHVNAANPGWRDPGAARGFETYFLAEARTEDARRVENMENESVRYETDAALTEGDPLSFILSDMKQNEHLRESAELADVIQKRLGTIHPGPSRGVKQAGFRVLVTAFMPAVLVEIGFGTNPSEMAYLDNPQKQEALASAIADAAVDYLRDYDRRVSGGSGEGKGGKGGEGER